MNSLIPATDQLWIEAGVALVNKSVTSPKTKYVYERYLRRFFTWYVQENPERGFCRDTVMSYRDQVMRPWGAATQNVCLASIRKLASELADNGYMDDSVAARICSIKQTPVVSQKAGRWLTIDELRNALRCPVEGEDLNRQWRDRMALMIMATCGLRRAEVAELRLRDLDKREGRAVFQVIGKRKKARTVPVHEAALTELRDWMKHAGIDQPHHALIPTINKPDEITRIPAKGEAIRIGIERVSEAAGVEFSPHDLRRTFALLAYRGGATFEEIRIALGHDSVQTTEIYIMRTLNLQQPATDRIVL